MFLSCAFSLLIKNDILFHMNLYHTNKYYQYLVYELLDYITNLFLHIQSLQLGIFSMDDQKFVVNSDHALFYLLLQHNES